MIDRPYLESWLRRTRKELLASGRLSGLALVLSRDDGTPADAWRARLQAILEGVETPTLDLLIRIDGAMAQPKDPAPAHPSETGGQMDLLPP